MFRQLLAFRNGTRNGETSGPMRAVASMLDVDQMIAVVAYAGRVGQGVHLRLFQRNASGWSVPSGPG